MKALRLLLRVAIVVTGISGVPTFAAKSQTLDQVIQISLDRNQEVLAQQEQLESVRRANLADKLIFLPSISGSASYARSGSEIANETDSRNIGLSASLNLFKFGADWATFRQAFDEIEREEIRLLQSLLSVESQTARAYFSHVENLFTQDVNQRDLETREKLLSIAKQRFKKGILPKEELDKVELDVENKRALLNDNEIAVVQSLQELERLLGPDNMPANDRSGGILRDWSWRKPLAATKPEDFAVAKKKDNELINRVDIRIAQKTLDIAGESLAQNRGDALPSLDLTGSLGKFNSRDYLEWTATLTFTVPLFDRLSGLSDYRSSISLEKRAEALLEDTRREAKRSWASARETFVLSVRTANRREKNLKIARSLYEKNMRRFRAGRASANDLQIDQNRLVQAELLAISGWKNSHVALLELCQSLSLRIKDCF